MSASMSKGEGGSGVGLIMCLLNIVKASDLPIFQIHYILQSIPRIKNTNLKLDDVEPQILNT